jgi:hypothetical protein
LEKEIAIALAPLQGLVAWGPARAASMLTLQLGEPRADTSATGRSRVIGEYALHVQCPWRLTEGARMVVGSGDLFTPAMADADPATFNWDVKGATWWDYQWRDFASKHASLRVDSIFTDPFGGFRLLCSGGVAFEVFPSTSVAEHDDAEYSLSIGACCNRASRRNISWSALVVLRSKSRS